VLIVSTRRFGGVVAKVKPWEKALLLEAIVQDRRWYADEHTVRWTAQREAAGVY